jgi:signal transduction histidine kinase
MVAVCALAGESILTTFFITARFSLGFYAIRLISMLVSKVVLITLVSQTLRLHTRLSIANKSLRRERENRLTSAEAVVGAIAHEVRQPLTGISLKAAAGERFLKRAEPDVVKAAELFEQIKGAAFRANEVFESFRSLFRGGRQEYKSVNINALVLESVELMRKELENHDIKTRVKLASELPPVSGNVGQLREVILNLVQNSMEAMAAMKDGPRVISVTTARHGSDSLAVSIEDTGPGIDAQKIAVIFDPFVTTKAAGTGLGLAICKMIVEQHEGMLSGASDADGGARFEMILPTKMAAPPVAEAVKTIH